MSNEAFAIHGYSVSNQMICVVDGDNIYQTDYTGANRQLVGKTVSSYNELEQTTTEYYNKLVELGIIVPPQDPEKMMLEMQKTMVEMSNIIKSLSDEVKELKKDGYEHNVKCSNENVSKCESVKHGTGSTGDDTGNA